MYDLRLKTPFTYLVSGATQSGKTTHVFNLLTYRHLMMDKPTGNVYYFYKTWQPHFDDFTKTGIVTQWINDLPTEQIIMEKSESNTTPGGCIFVIDDYMDFITQDISTLFTLGSHANKINVIFMTQNLFGRNPFMRTISLNALYIVVFKNPRDSSQIWPLARQLRPENATFVVDAYVYATKQPHTYMLFDNHQRTPDILRLRSHILPHEWPMRVYIPTEKKAVLRKRKRE
jgi:hypothetical protein